MVRCLGSQSTKSSKKQRLESLKADGLFKQFISNQEEKKWCLNLVEKQNPATVFLGWNMIGQDRTGQDRSG